MTKTKLISELQVGDVMLVCKTVMLVCKTTFAVIIAVSDEGLYKHNPDPVVVTLLYVDDIGTDVLRWSFSRYEQCAIIS